MIIHQRLELLVLARLSVATKSRPSRSDLSKVLYPFVQAKMPPAEWRGALEAVITGLREQGEVELGSLTLTDAGAVRLCAALGTTAIPETTNWAEFKKRHLRQLLTGGQGQPPKGATPARVFLADTWEVPIESAVSDPALANAYVMKLLDIEAEPLTLGDLRGALLARELGVSFTGDLGESLRQAAAKISEASSEKPDDIILAQVGRWVLERGAEASGERAPLQASAVDASAADPRIESLSGGHQALPQPSPTEEPPAHEGAAHLDAAAPGAASPDAGSDPRSAVGSFAHHVVADNVAEEPTVAERPAVAEPPVENTLQTEPAAMQSGTDAGPGAWETRPTNGESYAPAPTPEASFNAQGPALASASAPTTDRGDEDPSPSRRERLLNQVRTAMQAPGLQRFEQSKVLIAALWDVLQEQADVAMGMHDFKHFLVEAHERGELALAPGDAVGVADPEKLASSETRHLDSTYHFVRLSAPA